MGFFGRTIEVTTDSEGRFSFKDQSGSSDDANDDDGFNIVMKAKLLSPEDTTVMCVINLGNGGPDTGRDFTLRRGRDVDLRSWHVGQGGLYLVEISGSTEPPRPSTEVAILLEEGESSNS